MKSFREVPDSDKTGSVTIFRTQQHLVERHGRFFISDENYLLINLIGEGELLSTLTLSDLPELLIIPVDKFCKMLNQHLALSSDNTLLLEDADGQPFDPKLTIAMPNSDAADLKLRYRIVGIDNTCQDQDGYVPRV